MSINDEIILEGSYQYFQKDVNYSQENFKLIHAPETKNYYISAEILSRIETGEFLKVMVRFEMNGHFNPIFVRIEKILGSQYSQETFNFDLIAQELKYTFKNSISSQDFTRSLSTKHYLGSPAFSTSAIFTLTKKLDATSRTPIPLINSQNDWIYESPPQEKVIYAELKAKDVLDFKLNNTPLSASHLCLYEFNEASSSDNPVDIYVSKHYAIPYQLIHGDQRIVIKNLTKNGS